MGILALRDSALTLAGKYVLLCLSSFSIAFFTGYGWTLAQTLFPDTSGLPACEYEDSENCYWNAATMGNGDGTSFVNVNGEWFPVN
jgi:hypothetical protein